MKNYIFLLLLFIIKFNCFSQETPEKIISDFFNTYSSGETDKAIDNLYNYSAWIKADDDAVINLKTQIREIKQLVGNYNGYEFLLKKSVGNCLEHHVYIVKYDRQPFRFVFEFYKPKDKWITYSFSYDLDIDDDLEEAAKLEIITE